MTEEDQEATDIILNFLAWCEECEISPMQDTDLNRERIQQFLKDQE